jgi:mannose-6-phosphate isomerase-like protein (cupin superfamily)
MSLSRRGLLQRGPALAAMLGYSARGTQAAQNPSLPSKAFRFEDLAVHAGSQNNLRPVLEGVTHAGYFIEVHSSDLVAGGMPHPPHHHLHEEMFLVREGLLEVTIAGRASRLGPGSVAFVSSNEEHGIRNVGTARAQYFVLALGRDS